MNEWQVTRRLLAVHSLVQFKSKWYLSAWGKSPVHSTLSLRSLPSVTCETAPMLIWFDGGHVLSFQRRLLIVAFFMPPSSVLYSVSDNWCLLYLCVLGSGSADIRTQAEAKVSCHCRGWTNSFGSKHQHEVENKQRFRLKFWYAGKRKWSLLWIVVNSTNHKLVGWSVSVSSAFVTGADTL